MERLGTVGTLLDEMSSDEITNAAKCGYAEVSTCTGLFSLLNIGTEVGTAVENKMAKVGSRVLGIEVSNDTRVGGGGDETIVGGVAVGVVKNEKEGGKEEVGGKGSVKRKGTIPAAQSGMKKPKITEKKLDSSGEKLEYSSADDFGDDEPVSSETKKTKTQKMIWSIHRGKDLEMTMRSVKHKTEFNFCCNKCEVNFCFIFS